ncbi:transglutaminase-like cysteine peptidase [Pseudomonas resinovorans]|uniref:cysteine protease LapG n=1 Tax=Metapseudomonas resinovorans TaxID=53412 RepID=UPI00237F3534|nr:transglutaminase-like cysteine peptidase [Pseudomonas resinovorans]MDE3735455.1 transglutaminase-like cysteine peptidase [Pseudomonas resinovorans]
MPALVAALLPMLLVGALQADWDFTLISRRAESLYGPLGPGKQRIDDWQAMLGRLAGVDERKQLEEVNRFFNAKLRFTDDIRLWGETDYWATPLQALRTGAGDCEDFAIAKYFSLRQLGVPSEKLRITYVKALRLNQAHMVLTYYASPGAMPLVLDNLVGVIRAADQRTDLLPVYAFNAEGLWLAGSGGGKQVGDAKRLSRWQELLKKMKAEGFPVEPAG